MGRTAIFLSWNERNSVVRGSRITPENLSVCLDTYSGHPFRLFVYELVGYRPLGGHRHLSVQTRHIFYRLILRAIIKYILFVYCYQIEN